MPIEPTLKVYLGLVTKPYRFVIENRLSEALTLYERHAPGTLRDFLLALFKVLSEGRPDFMRTLAKLDDRRFQKTRQQRRFVCEDRSLVYIGSPHLTDRHTVQVDGYWLATNLSSTDAYSVAKLACEAAGLACASIGKLQL
ncbi:MAG: hypothetical protein ACRETF_06080 [Nevskiaceae bacterium]